jgi:hypothetical protein
MAQQTAVEYLIDNIHLLHSTKWNEIVRNAKATEKEQIIRFAISCHQDILRDRNAPENLISENLLLFEKYYNETYGE